MSSSDEEEGEISQKYVSDYYFVDNNDVPVSLSTLPVVWDASEMFSNLDKVIFLGGNCSNGIQKVYLPVVAWKFELSYVHPEIYVLIKSRKWIMLQKPRKSFESIIRKLLITVHWLHFIKKNPDKSERSVWKHLQKIFSAYDTPPSQNDLLSEKQLIMEAARRDKELEASKSFCSFDGRPWIGMEFLEDVQTTKDDYDDYSEEDQIFKQVCEICDDGGNILCCNGRCLRAFHPTVADGVHSQCASLGFRNKAEYAAIQIFRCKNCEHEEHQCFACGRLGSSARSASQQVFPCASATCGHFYHPECVARLLHIGNEIEAGELRAKIAAGESFVCPAHKCFICKQCEVADVPDYQFAVCRRCPKAYHRKCLPKQIIFEHDVSETNLQRAWEDLLPDGRILIYCMKHKIDRQLKTPCRDHILFPGVERTQTSNLKSRQIKPIMSKQHEVSDGFYMDKPSAKRLKTIKQLRDGVEIGDRFELDRRYLTHDFQRLNKSTVTDPAKKVLKKNAGSIFAGSSAEDTRKIIFGSKSVVDSRSGAPKSEKHNVSSSKFKSIVRNKPLMGKANNLSPSFDSKVEKRILALMEDVDSKFNIEEFMERNTPDTDFYCKTALDKSITLGLVEGSVEAIQTALQKLEEGCSIEDAKAVCQPQILKQIIKWKSKLKVYLAPFLHGARYTSFGRHFTQVRKINEIVDRLQHYVQDGDMIVDFCCGSNDFSCILKERLDRMGKTCLFKNFDLIQSKNDFCFERKNWLKVNLDELFDGSRLIMGLNPPFGVRASISNIFINKALQFNPKLIILITPKETERLDQKAPYDLIWEDDELLSGKAFYLPGSVDVNDKQMEDWNINPPPLYLWSRADWTPRHTAIAQQCGHFSRLNS